MAAHPSLLEISAWPWLQSVSREERRLATLGNVPPERWDRLARDGFDFLFLMGVWRRSPLGRELALSHPGLTQEYGRALPDWTAADVVGSPYCVQAYEPDERMGGWAGLEVARSELRSRGIRLVLDFVPNHTAFDHEWVTAHPDWYVLGTEEDYRAHPGSFRRVESVRGAVHVACARDPNFPPWTDVAQLNHFNPECREALTESLRAIATRCDGVRCDMAMLVLNDIFERTWRPLLGSRWPRPDREFWPVATAETPDLMYLAEAYWNLEGALLEQGFDYVYDKRVLDALRDPAAGLIIRDRLASERPAQAHLTRFIENHDEPRSAATLEHRLTAAASLVSTVPGMRFFFDGQFEGRRIRVPVQLGRWPDEPVDDSVRSLYERIRRFAAADVVQRGDFELLRISAAGDHTSVHIVAYQWRFAGALAIVALNPGGIEARAFVGVGGDLPGRETVDFEDALSGECYRRDRQDLVEHGLYVRIPAGGAHLFTVVTTEDR